MLGRVRPGCDRPRCRLVPTIAVTVPTGTPATHSRLPFRAISSAITALISCVCRIDSCSSPRCRLPSSARRARGRVLHPGRVKGRPPAALVVARELEVEALVRHAALDGTDAAPGVEPRAESRERMDIPFGGELPPARPVEGGRVDRSWPWGHHLSRGSSPAMQRLAIKAETAALCVSTRYRCALRTTGSVAAPTALT